MFVFILQINVNRWFRLQRFATAIKQDISCGTQNTENSDWHARVFVTTPAALLLMLLKVEEQSWKVLVSLIEVSGMQDCRNSW